MWVLKTYSYKVSRLIRKIFLGLCDGQCNVLSYQVIKCVKKTKVKVLNKDMRTCGVVKYSFENNNVSYTLGVQRYTDIPVNRDLLKLNIVSRYAFGCTGT